MREMLTLLLCSAALILGVVTSSIAAKNRMRGSRLDLLQRWSEGQTRSNDQLRALNEEIESKLLRGEELPPADPETEGEDEELRQMLQDGLDARVQVLTSGS